jgi:3-hydroxyisobutyrate dehydrogenase-like beta-hydroxyacid dehydrogenase
MGAAIGDVLHKSGLDVITTLEGRSARSRLRAFDARIREVASHAEIVRESDLVLSVVPGAAALDVAERVAASLSETRARITYVDCNAVSLEDTRRMARLIQDAGSVFVDAVIVGAPPTGRDSDTRFYCSGPDTTAFVALREHGLYVEAIGRNVGEARALETAIEAS